MIKRLSMTIPLTPKTKKNHSQIINRKTANGKTVPMLIPSKQYREYEKECGYFIKGKGLKIDYPVNIKCLYYMPTRRRVDLVNLIEATMDILVHYEVLEDDNCRIVQSHDGSKVLYDKGNPRTEVVIEKLEDDEIEKWK